MSDSITVRNAEPSVRVRPVSSAVVAVEVDCTVRAAQRGADTTFGFAPGAVPGLSAESLVGGGFSPDGGVVPGWAVLPG